MLGTVIASPERIIADSDRRRQEQPRSWHNGQTVAEYQSRSDENRLLFTLPQGITVMVLVNILTGV